jgi:inward rectifier potassium channel
MDTSALQVFDQFTLFGRGFDRFIKFRNTAGLFFGRFSRPIAFLKFSHNAVIGPYGDINGLMIRLTPFKNTNFTDAEAKITLGMSIEENGKLVNKFYTLDLELEKLIHFP